jgi:primosomal protein N' (replication factor Y)
VYAKIIPTTKLKFGLDYFDYAIPKEIESKIAVGQLVNIPFRNSLIFGVVFEITNTTNSKWKTKQIKDIVQSEPFLDKKYLQIVISSAKVYGVSASTILKMMLPPLQKRKISKVALKTIVETTNPQKKTTVLVYKNQKERQSYFNYIAKSPTLVLVPEKEDMKIVANLFENQEKVAVWHSNLSTKEQFEIWFKIRNQEKTIVIGTRGASFLPIPNLKNIIIDKEYHSGHKHWDQNPRFHTKDIANLYANFLNVQIFLTSHSPSSSSYYCLYKNIYACGKDTKQKISTPTQNQPTIISMQDERKGKNFTPFSWKMEEALPQTNGDIFLYINRRGRAKSTFCQDCGHMEKCEKCQTPLTYHETKQILSCHHCKTIKQNMLNCPICHGKQIKNIGIGTEYIEKEIKKILTSKNIYRIDKDEENLNFEAGQRIIVGTSKALKHVRWNKTDLIVFINLDTELTLPEFNAQEQVWDLIQEVQYVRKENSKFLLQTFSPDHFVFKSLSEPDRFYRMDLNSSAKLNYPPYSFIVKYMLGNTSENKTISQSEELAEKLLFKLTKIPKNCKILGPLESSPKFYRNKYWRIVLLKITLNETAESRYNVYTSISDINKDIPNELRIDPNPLSLLSP